MNVDFCSLFSIFLLKNNHQHNVSAYGNNAQLGHYSFFIFIFRTKNDNRSLVLCQFACAELPFFFFAFVEEHATDLPQKNKIYIFNFEDFLKIIGTKFTKKKKWVNIFILTCFYHSFLKLCFSRKNIYERRILPNQI